MTAPRSRPRVPSYRLHRPTGLAVVTLSGKDHYLGPHGTQASKAEYDRLVGEWMASGRQLPGDDVGLTVTQVCVAYWRHAEVYYRKGGKATSELACMRSALRPLRRLYGRTPARDFTPLALKAIQQQLVDDDVSRRVVNAQINRIRRVFKWAVAEGHVPADVLHGLQAVQGLQRGRSTARETGDVPPVPREQVEAVLPHVPRQVAAMIQLQLCTGMRPGEVVQMRAVDIDRDHEIWVYVPRRHKTQHHGLDRRILLGPHAQEVLAVFLDEIDQGGPLFSPRDAEQERRARQRLARKTPVQPSQISRTKPDPTRTAGDAYTTGSYRRAIQRGAELAGIDRWSPNQLRHTFLTEVDREFGLDAARACAGHTTPDTTTVYVQRDQALAAQVARRVG